MKYVGPGKISSWELPVEVFVAANPNPDPNVLSKSLSNGTIIPSHPDRPKTRIGPQPLKLERWMRGIFYELLVSRSRSLFDSAWKIAIGFPEI